MNALTMHDPEFTKKRLNSCVFKKYLSQLFVFFPDIAKEINNPITKPITPPMLA